MEKQKIIDKVVKLLALSENNSNTSEAESAKDMAAKLMAKHDISIMESEQKMKFDQKEQQLKRIKPAKYDTLLLNSISIFNGVALIIQNGYGSIKAVNIFIGTKTDIECNDYMIKILMQQRKYAWKKHLDEYKINHNKSPKQKESILWHSGFSIGVSHKLRELTEMKNNKIQEYGLVPLDIQDQALSEYAKQHKLTSSKPRSTKYKTAGFEAGKNAHIHKGIGKESKTRLIA